MAETVPGEFTKSCILPSSNLVGREGRGQQDGIYRDTSFSPQCCLSSPCKLADASNSSAGTDNWPGFLQKNAGSCSLLSAPYIYVIMQGE